MVLDPRLKKLAGVSARKAAAAFAKAQQDQQLTELERNQADEFIATLEGMFLMAAVDGEISQDEMDQLRSSVAAIADLGALGDGGLEGLLEGFRAKLEVEGWSARLGNVARRIPTQDGRVFAFRLAAAVAMVDDQVEHAEAAAIEAFAAALKLDAEDSQTLLREVVEELFGD